MKKSQKCLEESKKIISSRYCNNRSYKIFSTKAAQAAKTASKYTRIRTTITVTNYCWGFLVNNIPHRHSYPCLYWSEWDKPILSTYCKDLISRLLKHFSKNHITLINIKSKKLISIISQHFKGAVPEGWLFTRCLFLCFWKWIPPHLTSIWKSILKISRKSNFNDDCSYETADSIRKLKTARQSCKQAPIHIYQIFRYCANTLTVLTSYNEIQRDHWKLKFGHISYRNQSIDFL